MSSPNFHVFYLIREPGHVLVSINRLTSETAKSLNDLSMMKRMRCKWILEKDVTFELDSSAFPSTTVTQFHNNSGVFRTSCTQEQIDRARTCLPSKDR